MFLSSLNDRINAFEYPVTENTELVLTYNFFMMIWSLCQYTGYTGIPFITVYHLCRYTVYTGIPVYRYTGIPVYRYTGIPVYRLYRYSLNTGMHTYCLYRYICNEWILFWYPIRWASHCFSIEKAGKLDLMPMIARPSIKKDIQNRVWEAPPTSDSSDSGNP